VRRAHATLTGGADEAAPDQKGHEMAGETPITLVGNLVDDPELRFTSNGQAVARFRVASTPRVYDRQAGEWRDGESLFLTCTAWRQMAENVAESLTRGTRVIVYGRLRQRSYENREGERRTALEVEVDEVGPSLRNATARITKAARQGAPAAAVPADDPWATATPAPAAARQSAFGGATAPAAPDFPDEPPF